MNKSILTHIINSKEEGKKLLAVLLDPDKVKLDNIENLIQKIKDKADFLFVGGSTVTNGDTQNLVKQLKVFTNIPIVLFPGDTSQITNAADALLFLSLISGDNPEYLITQQLKSVTALQKTQLEIIPTGYILIDGGVTTAVQKVSGTKPIPQSNIELISRTAITGMYLGKQLIYLEAGSGATEAVGQKIIKETSKNISIPLIVGGGIRTKKQLDNAYNAGADLIVIGTAFEENNSFFDTF